ncbi:unnamed protein product [Closterium sp. Naga37s-1]|nr:unnamed protein product [Closterium sp. Naga37s-1]
MEEGIPKLRYGGAHYRREIRALMCEAGEGTLLESLKLKGADIPPQSEQQQEEEGESDDVVEVPQPALHPPRLIRRVLQHVLLQQQRVSQVPLSVLLLLERVSQVPMLVLQHLERFSQAPLPVLFQLERVCQGFRAPGAGVFAPQAGGVQPGASAHVAPAGPSGHALHRPNLLFHGSGHPTASVHLPLSSHGPGVQEPPAFLFAAEALDTGSILLGHTSSAPLGTLLNMPSQQVLPSPAASSSFMPSTQVGEEEEAASKGFTGVTKKKGKNEWVARIVLDCTSNSLIVISSHFQSEVAVARSIAAASHVMFVDNPTRGDLIPLTGGDRAKLQGCTAQQCELMVRQKFWHKWEQWAEYWPAAKAKYDEKERKAAMKRAALDRSLGQPGGRPDKMARTVGEGLSRGVIGDNDECVGSKDE